MKFKLSLLLNYNDLFLEIYHIDDFINEEQAKIQAGNDWDDVYLHDKFIYFNFSGCTHIINVNEKNRYKFQICKKEINPVDLDIVSKEELKKILSFDSKYMTTDEDYQDVPWLIDEAYKVCRKAYGEKDYFNFESLAYGCEPY